MKWTNIESNGLSSIFGMASVIILWVLSERYSKIELDTIVCCRKFFETSIFKNLKIATAELP